MLPKECQVWLPSSKYSKLTEELPMSTDNYRTVWPVVVLPPGDGKALLRRQGVRGPCIGKSFTQIESKGRSFKITKVYGQKDRIVEQSTFRKW